MSDNYKATINLTAALNRLTGYLEAKDRNTEIGAVMGEKASSTKFGNAIYLPASAQASQVVVPEISKERAQRALADSGMPGEDGSNQGQGTQQEWEDRVLQRPGGASQHRQWLKGGPESQSIPGVKQREQVEWENEEFRIPSYGHFQMDVMLEQLRNVAAKQAGPPGAEGPPGAWGSIASNLNKAVGFAAPYKMVKQASEYVTKPLGAAANVAMAAQEQNAQLGFNPENGAGGAYIMGIRNPLAAATSEAGRHGLGSEANVVKNVLSGGTSAVAAQNLTQALQEEGVSNQREGLMGMFTGGEQNSMEQAIYHAVPGAKTGALHAKVAAGFYNAARYGAANIHELQEAMEGMSETAVNLRQGLNETAEAMQSFGEESSKEGGTKIGGLKAYKNIAAATGMAPGITSEILQSPAGLASSIGQGILPGEMGSVKGSGRTTMAVQSVRFAEQLAGPESSYKDKLGPHGEVLQTGEEAWYAKMSLLSGISAEHLKLWHEQIPNIEKANTIVGHLEKAEGKTAKREKETAENLKGIYPHKYASAQHIETEVQNAKNRKAHYEQAEREGVKEVDFDNTKTSPWAAVQGMNKRIHEKENDVRRETHDIQPLGAHRAQESGREFDKAVSETEKLEGVNQQKIEQIQGNKNPIAEKMRGIKGVVEEWKANNVEEQSGEGKVLIELTENAKKYLGIKSGNGLKSKARAGGSSTASASNEPNTGETTLKNALEAAAKQIQSAQSQEQTGEVGH